MEELKRILLRHAERYPLMEPTDAVKLIYQNEFGGGHMIRDAESCMNYLRREYGSVKPDPQLPLAEPIGNGIVRIHLAALRPEDLERLGQAFIRSSARHTGNPEAFRRKLAVLLRLTEEGIFSFDAARLRDYLAGYEQAGYPAVSHSPGYRSAYAPAYRIVLEEEFPTH